MKAETLLERNVARRAENDGDFAVLTAAAVVIILLLIYSKTAESMIAIWYRSDTFEHGLLVFPISVWLVWRKRADVAPDEMRPFWPGVVVVCAAGFFWLLATLAGVAFGAHLALIAMLQGATITVLGIEIARRMTFPLTFLFFAVPAGEFLIPQLIDWTADFTVTALRGTGIPVYREANHFVIPSGSWSVVEECSGIRYLVASLILLCQ
jgi:exosortase A